MIELTLRKCELRQFNVSIIGQETYDLLYNFREKYKPTVSEWANTLKHRRMIKYEELSKQKYRACFQQIITKKDESILDAMKRGADCTYNSSKTLNMYKINDVINKLFEYHKDICVLSKMIFDKIEI